MSIPVSREVLVENINKLNITMSHRTTCAEAVDTQEIKK